MEPSKRWQGLHALCRAAEETGGIELRLFGSALHSLIPRDLDVLALYEDPHKLKAFVEWDIWELYTPPIDVIGMTYDEDFELGFSLGTGAVAFQ